MKLAWRKDKTHSTRMLGALMVTMVWTGLACHAGSAPLSSLIGPTTQQLNTGSVPAPIELAETTPPSPTPGLVLVDTRTTEPIRKARYVLMGVDCFGVTDRESCAQLSAKSLLNVGGSIPMGWKGNRLVDRLRRSGNYAYVGISPVFYTDGTAYVTIDVVEQSERERLLLLDPPNQTLSFSTNLLELYGEYSNLSIDLIQRGIELDATPQEGFWQSERDELAPYITLFRQQVPLHRQELIAVATREKDPTWRRAASGLLGFDTDDAIASRVLAAALLDPNPQVRSEAARALVPKLRKARDTGEALIAIDSVMRLLQLPSTADRTAALSVLNELVHIPALRKPILDQAFPILAQMLQASRPKASQSALQILESATGLNYGRDTRRWKQAIERL